MRSLNFRASECRAELVRAMPSAAENLKIKRFEDYTEEWTHFVYDPRTEPNGRTLHDYAIVYGPIATDRIGAQITRYKQGYISFEEFLKRIQYLKGITFQYASVRREPLTNS